SSSTSGSGLSGSSSTSSGLSGSSSSGLSGSSSSSGLSGSSSSGVQKGFGVAIVTFPASHGAPEVTVSLVRESSSGASGAGASATAGGQWKIDLPDTMTADKLQQNLAKHLDEVVQMKDQWPADANQAYEMIAHHVFMAFYDVNASGAGGASGGSGIRGSSG